MSTCNVGAEIRKLRESAELSQAELAGLVGVSRPSLVNIESDKRKVSAEELIRFAEVFGLTMDQIVDPSLRPEAVVEKESSVGKASSGLRISIPQQNYHKFKEVLLYLLTSIGARPHVGQTVLYKLLYFIDFDYYEKYEEQLIGAVYIKNHYGPTPIHFKKLVEEMEEEGVLECVTSDYFKYPQVKYLPLREPDMSHFSALELQHIDFEIGRLGSMNASQLSEFSHGDIPWLSAASNEKINFEMVFYRTAEYSVREYAD